MGLLLGGCFLSFPSSFFDSDFSLFTGATEKDPFRGVVTGDGVRRARAMVAIGTRRLEARVDELLLGVAGVVLFFGVQQFFGLLVSDEGEKLESFREGVRGL